MTPLPPTRTVPIDRQLSALRLEKEWAVDETRTIGPGGGFSDLLEGWASDGTPVAIKRIRRVMPGLATGEVKVARRLMSDHPEHVIPILDAGNDARTGHHYIVMPMAEYSLQDRLERDGPMVDEGAMAVLCDVLLGLSEMDDVAHGDLKPANVLFHENKWQIADMGIARILSEEPPAAPTRMFVSEPYAAPEQWRFELPTRATDVYAFGCLAYAVLTGEPPFRGPSQDDYRRQHMNDMARPLPAAGAVQALVQMCLNKDRASRPSIGTALVLLRRAWSKTK